MWAHEEGVSGGSASFSTASCEPSRFRCVSGLAAARTISLCQSLAQTLEFRRSWLHSFHRATREALPFGKYERTFQLQVLVFLCCTVLGAGLLFVSVSRHSSTPPVLTPIAVFGCHMFFMSPLISTSCSSYFHDLLVEPLWNHHSFSKTCQHPSCFFFPREHGSRPLTVPPMFLALYLFLVTLALDTF